jgi:hypothetical protein
MFAALHPTMLILMIAGFCLNTISNMMTCIISLMKKCQRGVLCLKLLFLTDVVMKQFGKGHLHVDVKLFVYLCKK